MIQLCDAVQHAHSRGILHRDIKPGNVLLTTAEDGQSLCAKLTDFGLALRLESFAGDDPLSSVGTLIGTPHYMAPEQIRGLQQDIGVPADVWALGCVLFELLTRQRAFDVGPKAQRLSLVLDSPPPSLRRLRPDIHPDLLAICEKCLEKSPYARYESASELKQDLLNYANRLPVTARRLSATVHAMRWCCRNPWLTLSLSLVVLLLASLLLAGGLYNASLKRHAAELTSYLERLEKSERNSKNLGYVQSTQLATQALERRDKAEARMLIAQAAELAADIGLTNESTQLLSLLAHEPQPLVLRGHVGAVREVELLADGETCVSVGDDGTIRQWDLRTGLQLQSVVATPERVAEPDGSFDHSLHAVAVSSDGRWLATGHHSLALYDLAAGKFLRYLAVHDTTIESIRFSADNRLVVSASRYDTAKLSSIDSGEIDSVKVGQRQDSFEFDKKQNTIICGTREKIGTGYRNAVARIPVSTMGFGELEELFSINDKVSGLEVTQHGDAIYIAHSGTIEYRQMVDGPARRLATDINAVLALSISPDSNKLASVDSGGQLVVWELDKNALLSDSPLRLDQQVSIEAHLGSACDVEFIDEKTLLTCGEDGAIKVWKIDNLLTPSTFNLDDRFVLSADHSWAISWKGQILSRVSRDLREPVPFAITDWEVTSLILTPDENQLLLGTDRGTIVAYDLESGRFADEIVISGDERKIKSLSISPDSRYLACAGNERQFDVRALSTGEEVHKVMLPERSGASSIVAFSPDGRWVVGADEGHLLCIARVDEWSNQRLVHSQERCSHLALSPDSNYVYSGHNSGRIRKWELESGKLLGEAAVSSVVGHIESFPSGKLIGVMHAGYFELFEPGRMMRLGRLNLKDIARSGMPRDASFLSLCIYHDDVLTIKQLPLNELPRP